jgi:hypothetical protein
LLKEKKYLYDSIYFWEHKHLEKVKGFFTKEVLMRNGRKTGTIEAFIGRNLEMVILVLAGTWRSWIRLIWIYFP